MQFARYEKNGATYKLPNGLFVTQFDGSVNKQAWDGSSDLWTPQRLVMSEAIPTNGGYALFTGRFGYWHKRTTGETRIYPVRNDDTKYILIAPLVPKTTEVRQVNDKYIELYYEKPDGTERWSEIIHEYGFKTNIRVRQGYTDNGEFQWRFEVVGLNQQGRNIYDGNKLVCRLPNPFATDGNGDVYPVEETLSNGVLTMKVSIKNPVFDINIDPGIGPDLPDADSLMTKNLPDTNFGSLNFLTVSEANASNHQTSVLLRDISAISPGSEIVAVDMELYYFNFAGGTDPVGNTINAARCTRTDWVENQVTYNSYKTGSAWTSGGGDFDDTNVDTAIVPAAYGAMNWNGAGMIAQGQEALDTYGALFSVHLRDPNNAVGNQYPQWYSKEEATQTTRRPKFTFTYDPLNIANDIIGDRMGSGGITNIF